MFSLSVGEIGEGGVDSFIVRDGAADQAVPLLGSITDLGDVSRRIDNAVLDDDGPRASETCGLL